MTTAISADASLIDIEEHGFPIRVTERIMSIVNSAKEKTGEEPTLQSADIAARQGRDREMALVCAQKDYWTEVAVNAALEIRVLVERADDSGACASLPFELYAYMRIERGLRPADFSQAREVLGVVLTERCYREVDHYCKRIKREQTY